MRVVMGQVSHTTRRENKITQSNHNPRKQGTIEPTGSTMEPTKEKAIMAKFDLDSYETVESRLAKFWADHPNGRVATKLEYRDERSFIVYSEIYFDKDDINPTATGYAEEIVGASPVNRTSALENCETSSLGRALSNCNYASMGKRPSREEMEKVERYQAEPRKPIKGKEPKVYTPEEISQATTALALVSLLPSKAEATTFWNMHKEILEVPVEGTTLKDALVKLAGEKAWM